MVYSAITIFLVPTVQDVTGGKISSPVFYIALALFGLALSGSLYFIIRLLIPVDLAYLISPQRYYLYLRQDYEQEQPGAAPDELDKLLKASYIDELEKAVDAWDAAAQRKSSFYSNALLYGLFSILPYLVCLAFHFGVKDEAIQKVRIVAAPK